MELDEFSEYFNKAYEPKVLITYSDNPHSKTRGFGKELAMIIPNSTALTRHRSSVKKICESSAREGYTDVIIINENRKKINGLLLIHLPGGGSTAHFKVSNVKLTTDIKRKISNFTSHRPEVILTNFSTRLGITIGRMLGSIFHYDPQFRGRRAATFHNQRDYIFFRHHRYEFDKTGKRAKLLELGPRFTLKLQSLQQGIFDSKTGDYEWMITNKRHQMEGSRRRFYLWKSKSSFETKFLFTLSPISVVTLRMLLYRNHNVKKHRKMSNKELHNWTLITSWQSSLSQVGKHNIFSSSANKIFRWLTEVLHSLHFI